MSLLSLFCNVHNFCQTYQKWQQTRQIGRPYSRGPKGHLDLSEVMTIVICFHQSGYRNFKTYYKEDVCVH